MPSARVGFARAPRRCVPPISFRHEGVSNADVDPRAREPLLEGSTTREVEFDAAAAAAAATMLQEFQPAQQCEQAYYFQTLCQFDDPSPL